MLKRAFTLAEILITLVVVGVVAAMTIPTLSAGYHEREKASRVKKAYSTIANAMKMIKITGEDAIIEDMNIASSNEASMKEWFDIVNKKLVTQKICYNTSGCWSEELVKTLNGQEVSFATSRPGIGLGDNVVSVILNDGTFASFSIWGEGGAKNIAKIDYDGTVVAIAVDVNAARKPNVIGKDIFYMFYLPEIGLVPPYTDTTVESRERDCSGQGLGLGCTSKYLNY